MDDKKLRAAISQARVNESNSGCLIVQILIAAIALGVATQSWWLFGIALIGLFICISIKPVAKIMAFVFAIAWGVIGGAIGHAFDSTGAMVVLFVIGFGVGLGVNLSGAQWFSDVSDVSEDNEILESNIIPESNIVVLEDKDGNEIYVELDDIEITFVDEDDNSM